jgi:flagellar biosynthesis protein FlhF
MTPQLYRGRTLDEAKQRAQAELGTDPVVLMTRKIPRAGLGRWLGLKDIEIAALPQPPATPRVPTPKQPFALGVYKVPGTPAPPASAPPSQEGDLAELRAEVRREMRALSALVSKGPEQHVESEIMAMREALELLTGPNVGKGSKVARWLQDKGIEGPAAAAIVRSLRVRRDGVEPTDEDLRDVLADLIRVTPWPLANGGRRIVALVGPTGVGKTTTAAKLAARAMAEHGLTVTLVSSDTSRVGGVEHLRRFAGLMNVGFEVAANAAELERAVRGSRSDLVILDTAGRSVVPRGGIEAALGTLQPTRGGAKLAGVDLSVLLCMPASIRASDARKFARAFAPCAPSALVATKIDETTAPAGLLHASIAAKLPLSILCFGPRVPEDIAPATAGSVVDHLLLTSAPRRYSDR